jgi:hypothetical protein
MKGIWKDVLKFLAGAFFVTAGASWYLSWYHIAVPLPFSFLDLLRCPLTFWAFVASSISVCFDLLLLRLREKPGEMLSSIKRELRIAFSKGTQPTWVRATKWAILLGVAVVLYASDFFFYWVVGLPFVGILTHFLYR